MKKFLFTLNIMVLALSAVSCSKEIENRGYVTRFSDFSKIQAGTSTKSDVIQQFGSPTTTSLYGDETWFYIGNEETKETFFEPEVKKHESYAIVFNEAGVVTAVNKNDRSKLRDFDIVGDQTETTGNEITFVQQLMGNLGKFNPAGKAGRAGAMPRSASTPGGNL